MPRVERLLSAARARLAAERGFTLMELMVACAVGMVVILAASNLLDSSGRASGSVLDRVDSTQRGRAAMEQVTQRLRSQVCPVDGATPVLYGDTNQVTFYADLSTRADGLFQPEVRRIRFNASERRLYEDVWEYQTTPPTATSAGSPTLPSYAATLQTVAPTTAPTSTRVILNDVRQIRNSSGVIQPVFKYFAYNTATPPLANRELAAPLTIGDRDLVVRVEVRFDSQPTRRSGGTAARENLDTRFENGVFVRTADPLQPARDPAACVT